MKTHSDAFKEIISECRRFARKEIQPDALAMDMEPDFDWLKSVWEKSRALDLPLLLIPESVNGAGYPEKIAARVLDVLAMECAGAASLFAGHFAACAALTAVCKKENSLAGNTWSVLKMDPLPLFSVVLPQDPDDSSLSFKKINGKNILHGQTSLVLSSLHADLFVLFIRDSSDSGPWRCVCVPKDKTGITINGNAYLPGLKLNPFAKMSFNEVVVDPDMIFASGDLGKEMLADVEKAYFGFIAAIAMGTSRNAFLKGLAYAKERYQFGKQIIHHEEIQRMLGAMQMKLGIGTAGYLQVFNDAPARSPNSRLAKVYCTDAALEIVQDAIQIHGGYGYMQEYGLEKIMRDVKILQLMGGRNPALQIQSIMCDL